MSIKLKDTADITAKNASSATSATKATQDSAGQQINKTYIKGLSVSGKTITYTKGDGSTGTITTQDTNTTYSAATQSAAGLMSAADKKKLDGVATSANNYSHPNSGVTASSYGPSANASPAHGKTFSVPYITVNAAGHITAASTKTITLPADNNTWRGVQNNLTSTATDQSLSAAQGKVLKGLIDSHGHTNINRTMTTTPIYNASSGILVDFNMNEKSGAMAIIKIYGNSYNSNPPIEAIYQFYDYADGSIMQQTGSAISGPAITLKVYRVGGKLKAWFQQPNSYCTFKLEVAYGNNGSTPNVTLSNAAEPTGATQTVTITPNRVYSAAYKPTAADIGAAKASHGTHLTIGTGASNAAAGNHTHSGYASSSHTHSNIVHKDTRDVNTTPDGAPVGLSVHLKNNAADGLSDGGTYHSSLFIKGWDDYSGGPYGNIAISANNNLWFRGSSSGTAWNSWKRVSVYGHTHNMFDRTSAGDIGYGTSSNHSLPVSVRAIAYWNGAYDKTYSNLAYCKHGAFGTMATKTSTDYLHKTGGTMIGSIKAAGLTGTWVDAAKNSNAVISSTASAGTFHPVYTFKSNNGSIVLAGYQGGLQCSYLAKSKVDAGENTVASNCQIFTENGGAIYQNVVEANQHIGRDKVVAKSPSGGIFTFGGAIGLASTDGSVFQACFRTGSSRAICDIGTSGLKGRLFIRSGEGPAGSGVSLENRVSNGTNYVQWLSPEAGTIALTSHISDRTKKDNIVYVGSKDSEFTNKDFYDFIKKDLGLATYTIKEEYATTDTHTKLNFIAQDILYDYDNDCINKVGNLIVQTEDAMEQQGTLKFDPDTFTSVIAGALKESIDKIEEDNEKIKTLENEVKELEAKNKALEELVHSMNERLLKLEDK